MDFSELLPWFALILILVVRKKKKAAAIVLICMLSHKTLNGDLWLSGVKTDDFDLPVLSLARTRKRKAFMTDPLYVLQEFDDLEEEFLEVLGLTSYFMELANAPQPRLQRRWWKDPTRPGNLFWEMEMDWPAEDRRHPGKLNENYLQYFRFQLEDFDMLAHYLQQNLPPSGNDGQFPNLHQPLSPRRKLAITLYWIAKGAFYSEVANLFDVGPATVYVVIRQVMMSCPF